MGVYGVFAFCFELMVAAAEQRVRELLEDQTQKRFVLNPEAMCTHTHAHAHVHAHLVMHSRTSPQQFVSFDGD